MPFSGGLHFALHSPKTPIMEAKKDKKDKDPSQNEEKDQQKDVIHAHEQAEKDISEDPDTDEPDPTDDLDEGELAQLDNSLD